MKWVLGIGGVIAAIVAAVFLIGLLLPENHTASRTARLSKPPERVWALVSDVGGYPDWRTDVDSVELLPPRGGNVMWREISKGDRMTYEAVTSEAPYHLVARISDKGLPFGGSWDYRIVRDGAGSRITITENGQVYDPIFRFVSKFIIGQTATIDKYLSALSAKLGDTYTPIPG